MHLSFKALVVAGAAAAALVGSALTASAATTPADFSNNQSGVEVSGGTYSYVQTVFTLPQVTPPNGQTSLAVYLADATQSVVLSLGPVSGGGGSYTATLQNEDPTPGLPPGYTVGYTDTSDTYSYATGDKVELAESYNAASGQLTYTVTDLTNDTVPVFSGQFTDLGQNFSAAFAGVLFASDVYGTPTAFTQPTAKTELVQGTHTLILDGAGANVTGVSRVRTAAGGSKLGVKLTSVGVGSAGKTFTVSLLS